MEGNLRRTTASKIMLVLAAFIIVVAGMRASTTILVPFLLAAFIAIISTPPMFWLQRKGIPKWFSLLIVIFGIVLIGSLIFVLVGSSQLPPDSLSTCSPTTIWRSRNSNWETGWRRKSLCWVEARRAESDLVPWSGPFLVPSVATDYNSQYRPQQSPLPESPRRSVAGCCEQLCAVGSQRS